MITITITINDNDNINDNNNDNDDDNDNDNNNDNNNSNNENGLLVTFPESGSSFTSTLFRLGGGGGGGKCPRRFQLSRTSLIFKQYLQNVATFTKIY